MVGVLINQHDSFDDLEKSDYLCLLCAPIVIPILIGMYINNRKDE
jgi:hypothetical protein